VSGCSKEAVRSLSTQKAKSAGCKEHYKEFKKKTKKDKTIDKWRYSA